MSDAARASVNVNLNPNLLSRLAAKVGAPRSLTVHRVADLSRQLHNVNSPREIEARVSQLLAALQAEAGAAWAGRARANGTYRCSPRGRSPP